MSVAHSAKAALLSVIANMEYRLLRLQHVGKGAKSKARAYLRSVMEMRG